MKFVVSALLFALALLFGVPTVGSAHALYHHGRHHHYRHWHYAGRRHYEHHVARGHARRARYAARDEHRHVGGLVHEDTAAGNITVAAGAAAKFKDLIAALVAKGFRGDVGCYAASGHIAHSLHHTGNACDFAQTEKNRTVAIMYHSGALIRSFGLRDGCSFGDCGHVDTGTAFADRGRHSVQHRYARSERRHVRRERVPARTAAASALPADMPAMSTPSAIAAISVFPMAIVTTSRIASLTTNAAVTAAMTAGPTRVSRRRQNEKIACRCSAFADPFSQRRTPMQGPQSDGLIRADFLLARRAKESGGAKTATESNGSTHQ